MTDETPRTRRICLCVPESQFQELLRLASQEEKILTDVARTALRDGLRQQVSASTEPLSTDREESAIKPVSASPCPVEPASKSEDTTAVSTSDAGTSPSVSGDAVSKAEIVITGDSKDAGIGPRTLKPVACVEIGISAHDESPAGTSTDPKAAKGWRPGDILGTIQKRKRPLLDTLGEPKSEPKSEKKVVPTPDDKTSKKEVA